MSAPFQTQSETGNRARISGLAVGIFLLAALTFLPSLWNDFISLDDSLYIYGNTLVKGGLTPAGIAQAFAAPACKFYHPFTMLSLMLDHQVWGLNPLGYHLTSLLWHASASAVLFLALSLMTGTLWRSAIVAALFAVHPLRVESVVWAAERKDVLSVFFFALTLLVYGWYARRPTAGRYAALLGSFTVGLLCKTTLVTMPFLLLLLDYWPLGRFGDQPSRRTLWRLVREKIPLVVLAIGATGIAMYAQKAGTIPYPDFPLDSRLKNAALTVVGYIGQTFFPAGMAPMYPFSESSLAPLRVTSALIFLAVVTILAAACRRRRPYVIVGWLWYLGVLLPMLGLIQVCVFAHADRFTYAPQIGLLIIVVWGAHDLARRWALRPAIPAAISIAVVIACVVLTILQIHRWTDSETLFRHTLAVTKDNGMAQEALGAELYETTRAGVVVPEARTPERQAEALVHLREAARLLPDHADAHLNLGLVLADTEYRDEAIAQLRTALTTMTFHAHGHFLLGLLLLEKGQDGEATQELERSLAIEPANAAARMNLGALYRRQGRTPEAIGQYRAALQIAPGYAAAHYNLAVALLGMNQKEEAIREVREAVRLEPGNPTYRQGLDFLLNP